MKRLFKLFVLVVALVVPVLIYLFLKGFGENHFAIPVYYEDGITLRDCVPNGNKTHLVEFESYPLQSAHLFYIPQWVNSDEFYRQSSRIQDKWPNIQFTAIADSGYSDVRIGNKLVILDQSQLYQIANCSLVLGQDSAITSPIFNKLVLVDQKKRIRGYYRGDDLEDMDRLDIELDILHREEN